MEEKMEKKEAPNIYQRIVAVMREVDYIQKSDKKVNNQYRFVSHDQVAATIHPALVKHGIAVIPNVIQMKQDGNRTEIILEVSFINADNPQDMFKVTYPGLGIDPSDKGAGKAISYAIKYAILKTFVLETGDDPDNDAEAKYVPEKVLITLEEARRIEDMLKDIPEFREKVIKNLHSKGIESIGFIPRDLYLPILKAIEDYKKE